MAKLRRIVLGLTTVGLIAAIGVFVRGYTPTHATSTLSAANNQVINISTTDGQPVNAATTFYDYSGDGNVVLFGSQATNLPNAGGGYGGLYTYNISTNTTTRIDLSTSGVQANYGINDAKLSESGRYALFMSWATNLFDGYTKQRGSIYLRDTQTGVTKYIGGGDWSNGLSQDLDRLLGVSNDGRYDFIASRYTANSYPYSYGQVIIDNASGGLGATQLAHGNDIEGSHDGTNTIGSLSCDGAFAVYENSSDNVVLADLRKGTTINLTVGNSNSESPVISCNGRYVLYDTTNRTDITPTPTGLNSYLQEVRYDRITGQRMYIDSSSSGTFTTTTYSFNPLYEPGKNDFYASVSNAGDVVLNYNGYAYLKHLSDGSGTLEPIANTASGTSINVTSGTLTSDGRYIFFMADPYSLGMASSPSTAQLIRVKTNL